MSRRLHHVLSAPVSNAWKSGARLFPTLGKGVAALLLASGTGSLQAADDLDVAATAVAKKLETVDFVQKLNAQLPLDLTFTDETGARVTLGSFFSAGRPVVLTLNYFSCPMLCTLVLNGAVDALKDVKFQLGKDIEVITVSFDPRDKPELAAKKKANYIASLGQPGAEKGWHFLTGEKEQIDRLCEAVGFTYVFDEKSGEFGHASGIMVATPQGRLSHYFYGVMFEPKDVRLALVASAQNQIGSPVEKILLRCFLHYDAVSGKYSKDVMGILRTGCLVTLTILFGFLAYAFRHEFRRPRKAAVV